LVSNTGESIIPPLFITFRPLPGVIGFKLNDFDLETNGYLLAFRPLPGVIGFKYDGPAIAYPDGWSLSVPCRG